MAVAPAIGTLLMMGDQSPMVDVAVINVLYFARIKDALGLEKESLELEHSIKTVNDLVQYLAARGAAWRDSLIDNKVLIAVNQEICGSNENIKNGDEVAFFPPVTGG